MKRALVRCSAVCAGVLCAVALGPKPAAAQDSASAQALFDLGVSELEAGHFAKACPALEESQRLEPRAGTLFALADCQAGWGKLASAVAHYEEYLDFVSRLPTDQQARHADRVASARAQLRALGPKVPRLTIALPAGAPAASVVERDGVALGRASLGVALPIDPGPHQLRVRAPGFADHSEQVVMQAGEVKRIELGLGAANEPPASAVVGRAPSTPDAGPANSAPSRKTWAWVAGGVGVAGLAVGTVAGLMVLGKKTSVDANCGARAGYSDPAACNSAGKDAADGGRTLASVSTVGFGVGLGALAASVVLLVTAPRPDPSSATPLLRVRIAESPRGLWAGAEHRF